MATSLVKLKVGFTTIFALIILFGGVFWIKEYKPGLKTNTMSVLFRDSKGVSVGDPVTLSGVKVGKISRITLNSENLAIVIFSIRKTVQLHSDARFRVYEIGLMGDKALVIDPGKAKEPLDMSRIQTGADTPGFQDLIAKSETVLNQLNTAGAKFNRDVDFVKLSSAFEQTLENVRKTLSAYRIIAEENRKSLSTALKNVDTTSGDIRTFMNSTDARLARAIDSFQVSSDRLSETLTALQPISVTVDTLAAYMKSGNGTLAKLIKTDDLYNELRQTNATLDSFVTDFRRDPGKYTKDMKFKVRLF
ncbi:MAG: MlaD family protein [Candidatus Latescibacter sp.]|nr:MlaD family protein [Candidatus Latescibacter sp.]